MFPTHPWTLLRRLPAAVACVALAAAAAAPPASAIQVQCGASGDGDAFGWAVATGGDYDGDGVADVAVGAPCAWVGSSEKAGRVRVFSGASGALIASLGGASKLERYGAALDFVADLNGDGKDELVIGASQFDAPQDGGGTRKEAGRVEVRSAKSGNPVVWEAIGPNGFANLGETVATLADLDGDGKKEIVAGASEAVVDGDRNGAAYVYSGANGALLGLNSGELKAEHWASLVGLAGDADGDGTQDFFVSANSASLPGEPAQVAAGAVTTTTSTTTTTTSTTTTLIDAAGRLSILSGKPPFEPITELLGEDAMQRFGRAAVGTSDGNNDGLADLWIGSSGDEAGGQSEAGAIELYSGKGSFIRRIIEPSPQSFAGFGTSLAAPGSLDGGQGSDVVAGAPTARVGGRTEAGRVHAFNGSGAGLLWTQSGTLAAARLGWSLDSGIDYNGDSIPDIVAGSPGATPEGRRGAGAAYLLSGSSGGVLASFAGRRGRETRLFVAGPGLDRRPVVRSFDPFGRRREAEVRAFRGQPTTALSVSMLDESARANAASMLIAVAAGKDGGTSNVAVYRATRRRLRVSLFAAELTGYSGSVNVAGGNFATQASDEIAVAPADDFTGTVDIAVHRRQFTDPVGRISWIKVREFPAYKSTDTIEGSPVNAVGVHLVGGNVVEETNPNPSQDEIITGPAAGLPVVRVFGSTGTVLSQWQAYPLIGPNVGTNSGTSVAIANLRGNDDRQIITAPSRGQLWVRAWKSNGDPFQMTPDDPEVNFFVTQFGPVFEGGLTITAADIDFDGADEILVAPGAGIPARILAFEADGTLAAGWVDSAVSGQPGFLPYGPSATGGLTLVGTDDFWRP